jgi:protein-disulfide isomerase-like protein with CxxC motif
MARRHGNADRWFITEQGVRHLCKLAGMTPEQTRAEVDAWKREKKQRAEHLSHRLHVTSGQTLLKPEDAERLRYTTEGPA